ncbi:MAG: arylsulfatase [Opitutales bacterium]|nr:arylsulfatase [Opitutales bacterium]
MVSLLLGGWIFSYSKNDHPNIIIIYADDVGYGDLGCYGAQSIDTPNLDLLARTGIRFTSAYATSSTCTPSRYSLLTGEYAFRNQKAKILPGNAPLIIELGKKTIASMLRNAGYTTGLVGKWHLGLGQPGEQLDWNGEIKPGPMELGFDYSFHMAATGDRVPAVYIKNGRIHNLDQNDPVVVSYEDPVGQDPTGTSHPSMLKVQADPFHSGTIVNGVSRIGYMSGGYSARWTDEEMGDKFLNEAIGFIRRSAKQSPFFLFYTTHENHVPRIPHPRFRGSTSLGVRGDAVAQMDWGIGQIIQELKDLDIRENTLIIFSSDNGPVLYDGYYDGAWEQNGNHHPSGPWKGGKYSVWEGGTRVPFIVSWPSQIEPALSDALISQVDLFATFAELVDSENQANAPIDSKNLLQALMGKTDAGRDHVIQQGIHLKAIRKGDWKYIPSGKISNRGKIGINLPVTIQPPGALLFLPEDPNEEKNLAHLYPRKVKELAELLESEIALKNGIK